MAHLCGSSGALWLRRGAELFAFVDYVRVWQRKGTGENGYSCDPPGYPTTKYIQDHYEAYVNPNLSTWSPTYDRPLNSWVSLSTLTCELDTMLILDYQRDPGSC